MKEENDAPRFLIGLDPGGARQFGWCICCIGHPRSLELVATGIADHALGAVEAAVTALPSRQQPVAASIDAPMYWVTSGTREADRWLRAKIGSFGAPSPGGTVQHFNSLRGACVIQGVMAARLLRERYPGLRITEAHPKAMLWLMGLATRHKRPNEIALSALGIGRASQGAHETSEHVRDAALAAMAAAAMFEARPGWVDRLALERNPVMAVSGPLGYWLPQA